MRVVQSATLCAVLALLSGQPIMAQDHGKHGQAPSLSTSSPSIYTGMERRGVKALSDEQISELMGGRGIGLALPAELNGYPGPSHVLELADAMRLSDEQRARTKALFEQMKAQAITIGERYIAEETALDRLFAEKHATTAAVKEATARIGAVQGELRAAHLEYHLAMLEVLSPGQVARYGELRGYAPADTPQRRKE